MASSDRVSIILTLFMLNKLRYRAHFSYSAKQITWSRLLMQMYKVNDKQCRSRSVGFRSQLIWIYTICKDRTYTVSAGQGFISSEYHCTRTHHFRNTVRWQKVRMSGLRSIKQNIREHLAKTILYLLNDCKQPTSYDLQLESAFYSR